MKLVSLLLQSGALPSVPASEDRLTPLHEAAASRKVEVIKLLLQYGADTTARDRFGNTPKQLATVFPEVIKIFDELPNEQKIVSASFPLPSPCVVLATQVESRLGQIVVSLGGSLSKEVGETTTHWVATPESLGNMQHLMALSVGAEVVGAEWLHICKEQGSIVETEQYRLYREGREQGASLARLRRGTLQPRILSGLHIYLHGTFTDPGKPELQTLVKIAGAKLLTREPDPEWIPDNERGVPHYGEPGSSLINTSHIILYQKGSRKEPECKYGMSHLKTLPVSWLLLSVETHHLAEPEQFL